MIAHLYLQAIRLGQQISDVGRHKIDHVFLRRFAGSQRGRPAHRLLRPCSVASAKLCERADIGDRIVQHLVRLGVSAIAGCGLSGGFRRRRRLAGIRQGHRRAASQTHRRRCAQMCGRRHRGDLPGIQNIGSGGRGTRPAGCDVHQHRHLAGQHAGDDLPHRILEPAGCIQPQHDSDRTIGDRTPGGIIEVFRRGGSDRTIQRQLRHHPGGCCGCRRTRGWGDVRRRPHRHRAKRHHACQPQPTRHHTDPKMTSTSISPL